MSTPFESSCPVRLRPVLRTVAAYVAGQPARDVPGLTTFKLSSNENPYPPLASVLRVIADAAVHVNRYPDMTNTALKAAIADHYGYSPDTVAVGPGSTGVLAQLIGAFCDPGDEVIFAWRSFEAYPILVQLVGGVGVRVPLNEAGEHDLDAMAAAITPRTRLIFVCTPNNPSGTIVTDAAARAFLAQVPPEIPVIWDEAYGEFVRDPQASDALALQSDHPNVIALRTFSKAYGLAGLRVGYSLSHPAIAEAASKTAIPFSVNLIAQQAAVGSLAAQAELDVRVDAIVAERERVVAGLRAQGWRLPQTQSNFVYFPLGAGASEASGASETFDAACADVGLVVRRYGSEGVRVTIGEPEANTRFLGLAATLAP